MDFLKQLLAFRDYELFEAIDDDEKKSLSTGQISLYYSLLQMNNKAHWKEWFNVANRTLITLSGLSRSGIAKNRNILKQRGLIDFRSNGTKATTYKIYPLYTMQDSAQDSTQDSTQNSTQDSTQNSTQNSSTYLNINSKQKQKQSNNSAKSKKRTYAPDDINYKLAQYLLEKIRDSNPESYPVDSKNQPNLQGWANDIRLMHERDQRTYEQIKKMIEWCQNNEFWHAVVLSAANLRKKYAQMSAQANKDYQVKARQQQDDKPLGW